MDGKRMHIGLRVMLALAGAMVVHAADPIDYFKGDWQSFQSTKSARQTLQPENLDTNLIAAAILHATNHQRHKHGLPALKFHPGARQAAAWQAKIMRERGSISHVNPDHPRLKTLEDRARAAGLEYRYIAENVATAFGLRYESGKPFYTRTEDGTPVFSYEPGGKPIPAHTYASFAETLVKHWMKSPGHRKNILSDDAQYMGASCFPRQDETGMVKFYCAQVFFTPLDD